MRSTKRYLLISGFFAIICCWSCKKWDDHLAVTEQALNENLLEEIGKHAELSKFNEYLVKTGLDKEISSSRNHTVWAPTNTALAGLSADTLNDVAKLKIFLQNHIAAQLFFTRMAADSVRVSMLNGKRVFAFSKKLDDANITTADIYVKNGVLNILDRSVSPLPSIWEYMMNTKATYTQNNFLTGLNYTIQDPTQAVIDSINPATGLPVYKPGTGIIEINSFKNKVFDVSNEDSLYTYIILNNTAYTSEINKQKPFFASSGASAVDTTARNAAWNTSKDLAFRGIYQPSQLPDSLISKFNVHVAIKKMAILETHKVSNGIVYVMSEAQANMQEKIPTVIIQGENPFSFLSSDPKILAKIFYRSRYDSLTGKPFNDIYLNLGSTGVNFYVDYLTNNLYTTKYKVYWVAFSDRVVSGQADDPYGTDSTMKQTLKIWTVDTPAAPILSVDVLVKPRNYQEVYIGDYTNTAYGWLLDLPETIPDGQTFFINRATRRLRLQAPAAASTGVPANLTLDYIKLVPVL